MKIYGLCCPDTNEDYPSSQCETCIRACKNWPLESVICFERDGSSSSSAHSGRSFGLDVCLKRSVVDRIINSRPGGAELLCSEQRVLWLLGRAEKYEIKCADNANRPLYIVRYSDAQIAEIRRVINQADLDTKDISPQKVTNAIMRSFAISDGSPVPRMDGQC